jgi:triacylglycerol lipase
MQRLIAAVVVTALAVVAVISVTGDDPLRIDAPSADAVVLIPGYGGDTGWTEPLAATLTKDGTPVVIADVGTMTGDLATVADAVIAQLDTAGIVNVDLVGYSAGGVVARAVAARIPTRVHRVATIGSPHDGTPVAGLGALITNDRVCPEACRQLAPDSPFLESLHPVDDPTRWLNLWSESDEVVPAASSATFTGTTGFPISERCGAAGITHSALPTETVTVTAVTMFLRTGQPGC